MTAAEAASNTANSGGLLAALPVAAPDTSGVPGQVDSEALETRPGPDTTADKGVKKWLRRLRLRDVDDDDPASASDGAILELE